MTQQKSAIVTGSYGAIGKAIALGLAEKGYSVMLVGRNKHALHDVTSDIIKSSGNNNIEYCQVDLSDKNEIENFAKNWNRPLNVLINNAATTPRSREETKQGIEMQFATNVLGYFWMIKNFVPYMEGQEDARIVNVASYWAGGLDLEDVELKTSYYDNDDAYRRCKQANRMLSAAFAEILKDKNISVFACHPGDVRSKLSTSLGYGGHESPAQGADTPVWCATSQELKDITGKYFEHRAEVNCKFSADKLSVNNLYKICEKY